MKPRRKRLTVMVHNVPPPIPRVGQRVRVLLGHEGSVEGVVYQQMGFGSIRVELEELE